MKKIMAGVLTLTALGLCSCSQPTVKYKYVHIVSVYNIREDKVYTYNGCLKHIQVGEDPDKWILIEDYDPEHTNLRGMLVSESLGVYDTREECPYCN